MIKETINFVDIDGNNVSEDLYFHISKTDLIRLRRTDEYKKFEKIQNDIQAMLDKGDNRTDEENEKLSDILLDMLEYLVKISYGKRVSTTNAEGEKITKFVKNASETEEFINSDEYGELIAALLDDDGNRLLDFIKNLFPADTTKKLLSEDNKQLLDGLTDEQKAYLAQLNK